MTEKLYVINKIEYMYNDEIFYAQESETYHLGTPFVAFRDKEKALKECRKLSLEAFCESPSLGSYFYGDTIERISGKNSKMVNEELERLGITREVVESSLDFSEDESSVLCNYLPEQIMGLLDLLNLHFFEVIEVTLGESNVKQE